MIFEILAILSVFVLIFSVALCTFLIMMWLL